VPVWPVWPVWPAGRLDLRQGEASHRAVELVPVWTADGWISGRMRRAGGLLSVRRGLPGGWISGGIRRAGGEGSGLGGPAVRLDLRQDEACHRAVERSSGRAGAGVACVWLDLGRDDACRRGAVRPAWPAGRLDLRKDEAHRRAGELVPVWPVWPVWPAGRLDLR
jgi:hypothetical protein